MVAPVLGWETEGAVGSTPTRGRRKSRQATERRFQMSTEVMTCNKAGPDCEGDVTYWLRPSDYSSWPKCPHHLALATKEHERIERTYGVTSDVPPAGFDPTACGEVWDDE